MSKLGKLVVALALCLMMSLALLTTSFAQSANQHAAAHASVPTTAQTANWGGGFGCCDCCFGGFGGWGW